IPSTLKPFDLWKFRTAVRVLLPNMPSALPQLKPSAFSLFCRALTWLPLLPTLRVEVIGTLLDGFESLGVLGFFGVELPLDCPLLLYRAFIVLRPTIPSTLKPFDLWKFRTAVRVLLPNMPSALPQLKPSAFSLFCRALT